MNDRSECQQCHSPEPVVTVAMRLRNGLCNNGLDDGMYGSCAASSDAGLQHFSQPAGLVQFIKKTNENNEMETHETKRKYGWKIDDDCSRNINIFFEMFRRIEIEKDLYRIAS